MGPLFIDGAKQKNHRRDGDMAEKIKITTNLIKILVGEPSRWWVWDQEVCSLCGLRFESRGCSYDGHWKLTWSLTSGPVGLVEVHASWLDTHVKLKKILVGAIARILEKCIIKIIFLIQKFQFFFSLV